MFTAAKIMQTSAMKACFQIAECSLSYAKLQVRYVKSWHRIGNYFFSANFFTSSISFSNCSVVGR